MSKAKLSQKHFERLLDSAATRSDSEALSEDEQLALLVWCGYTDWTDMEDYDCD